MIKSTDFHAFVLRLTYSLRKKKYIPVSVTTATRTTTSTLSMCSDIVSKNQSKLMYELFDLSSHSSSFFVLLFVFGFLARFLHNAVKHPTKMRPCHQDVVCQGAGNGGTEMDDRRHSAQLQANALSAVFSLGPPSFRKFLSLLVSHWLSI